MPQVLMTMGGLICCRQPRRPMCSMFSSKSRPEILKGTLKGSICTRLHQPSQGNENVARWRPKTSNRHMMGMKQDRSYVSEVSSSDVNTEKCVSQGAELPRADENELPRGESFHLISPQAIFSRAGRRPKSAAEPSEAQTPSWTLSCLPKHGANASS